MKRDWVTTGIVELVGGTLAILASIVVQRTWAGHSMLLGLGFIFVVIGAIVLTHGLRARNQKEGLCVICGRPIEFGGMYCHKCNPR